MNRRERTKMLLTLASMQQAAGRGQSSSSPPPPRNLALRSAQKPRYHIIIYSVQRIYYTIEIPAEIQTNLSNIIVFGFRILVLQSFFKVFG